MYRGISRGHQDGHETHPLRDSYLGISLLTGLPSVESTTERQWHSKDRLRLPIVQSEGGGHNLLSSFSLSKFMFAPLTTPAVLNGPWPLRRWTSESVRIEEV